MRDLIDQIRFALNQNLYYPALFVSLSLPDICGAIDSANGEADKQKYIDWFNRYVGHRYQGVLSSEDCYYFRCSLLHQGSSQHRRSNYSRILFVEPQATSNVFHRNILNDALNIDVRIFCEDILSGVENWLKLVEGTTNYQQNYDRFIRRYPNGLSPYIVGMPVIG